MIASRIKSIVRGELEPHLKAAGFKKKDRHFWRKLEGSHLELLNIQGSVVNRGETGGFWVNMAVWYPPGEEQAHFEVSRVPSADDVSCLMKRRMPRMGDWWRDFWEVTDGEEPTVTELSEAWTAYGRPWFRMRQSRSRCILQRLTNETLQYPFDLQWSAQMLFALQFDEVAELQPLLAAFLRRTRGAELSQAARDWCGRFSQALVNRGFPEESAKLRLLG